MVQEITPQGAWDYLQKDRHAILLDVRSTQEFNFVGHPLGALHVPLKEPPSWEIVPNFVAQVGTLLAAQTDSDRAPMDQALLVICRSGQRSQEAAELLLTHGYTTVYNIGEGFEGDRDNKGHRNTTNGWRFHNLPWEQS